MSLKASFVRALPMSRGQIVFESLFKGPFTSKTLQQSADKSTLLFYILFTSVWVGFFFCFLFVYLYFFPFYLEIIIFQMNLFNTNAFIFNLSSSCFIFLTKSVLFSGFILFKFTVFFMCIVPVPSQL